MPKTVTFWFEFASTYSYLSAMRIKNEASKRGVPIEWKPFLLGPIFAEQGWNTSPFNIYAAKGRHMWRDMERQCEKYGLELHPAFAAGEIAFPQKSLLAARTAIAALREDWGEVFCQNIYLAQFAAANDISDPSVVGKCIETAGGVDKTYLDLSNANGQKDALRANTERAQQLGIFGAPSFTIGEELFWGDDRLEDALDWALKP